jgi:glutaredoxin
MSQNQPPRTSLKSLIGLGLALLFAWGAREWLGHHQTTQQGETLRQWVKSDDIVVYGTDTCPYCAQARQWLTTQGLPWRDCNVEHDAQCRAEYEAKGAPGVPMLKVREQWQLGFDPRWLVEAIKNRQPT